MTRAAYIVSAVRTPIGKFGGGLADLTAADLGVIAVRAALERAFGAAPPERKPAAAQEQQRWSSSASGEILRPPWRTDQQEKGARRVDELIFGNARPAGVGPNLARQIAWRAGLGDVVPALTVTMASASPFTTLLPGRPQEPLGVVDLAVAA